MEQARVHRDLALSSVSPLSLSLSASLSLVSLETERKHERSRKHVLVIVRENETATWQRGENETRLSRHVVVDGIWSIDEKVSRRRRQKLRYPRLVGFCSIKIEAD